MAHLLSHSFAFLAVLVATSVSQSALRVNPAEAEDAHSKYSLHNRQQCQRLCWYTGVCLRYSYRTKTQTGADYPHNCVIHVTGGQGEELEEGWMQERASGDSLSESHGCKERHCGTDDVCIPFAAPSNAHVCARIPDIDECSSSPCQNGGKCQDQVNAYTCTCAAGYTGDHCQTEIHAVLNDGSVLLFRVTPGINQSAYHRFTAIGDNDDNTPERLQAVPAGCKITNGSLPCDRHYRSRLLDQSPLSFKTIRVGLYKDSGEQAFFEFNATGADYMNWFRRERLLTSSYTDITHNPMTPYGNYFSIEGDDRYGRRRFFINHNYNGCPGDVGWLLVVDKSDPTCYWERNSDNSYPSVLYMAGTSSGVWNNTGRAVADSMVISGRLDTSSPASPQEKKEQEEEEGSEEEGAEEQD